MILKPYTEGAEREGLLAGVDDRTYSCFVPDSFLLRLNSKTTDKVKYNAADAKKVMNVRIDEILKYFIIDNEDVREIKIGNFQAYEFSCTVAGVKTGRRKVAFANARFAKVRSVYVHDIGQFITLSALWREERLDKPLALNFFGSLDIDE